MYIKGEDLKSIRKSAGLTITEAAQLERKNAQNDYELGKECSAPNINQFLQLCRGYGLDCHKLMTAVMQRNSIGQDLSYNT